MLMISNSSLLYSSVRYCLEWDIPSPVMHHYSDSWINPPEIPTHRLIYRFISNGHLKAGCSEIFSIWNTFSGLPSSRPGASLKCQIEIHNPHRVEADGDPGLDWHLRSQSNEDVIMRTLPPVSISVWGGSWLHLNKHIRHFLHEIFQQVFLETPGLWLELETDPDYHERWEMSLSSPGGESEH